MSRASLPPSLTFYRNRHAGETIVVCGCGRSLAELPEPERWTTIGVNDVGRLFDPTYLVVVNPKRQFRGDRFRYVAESRARALFTQLDPQRDLGISHPSIIRFRLGRRAGTEIDDPKALPFTRNSPYVAVCLAAFLGARRIGLIGVDFTDHHFFAATGTHPLSRELAQIDREYGNLAAALARRGIELVNLSRESRLSALPKAAPTEFLGETAGIATKADPGEAPRVFFVHYQFLSCGDVFTRGLENAARDLGLAAAGAPWDDPRLPEQVERFRPDLLFVVHGRRFRQRWGSRFRGLRSAVWLLDEPYEVDDTEQTSRIFDFVFVNDPSTLRRHHNAHYLPVAWDPHTHRAGPDGRCYDAGFIGGGNPTREAMLLRLAREKLLSYVVGGPWQSPELRALTLSGNIPAARTAELYRQTRLVINVFRDRHHFNRQREPATSLNPRVYEALACGALVVSEDRPELSAVFPELPRFTDAEGLTSAVRALLADPERRRQLLTASRERLAFHTYAERLRTALEIACGRAPDRRGDRPMPTLSESPALEQSAETLPSGWRAVGEISVLATGPGVVLDRLHETRAGAAAPQPVHEAGLVSSGAYTDVELSFEVKLRADAWFVAKLHQQDPLDPQTNSYHLLCRPGQDYIAKHHVVLAPVRLPRGRWLAVKLRRIDQSLELVLDGRRVRSVTDQQLQSGYCFLGISAGRAELRNIGITDLGRPREARPQARARQPLAPLAFSGMPRRNLLYHVWPVKDSNWRWNLEQLRQRLDVFNGRRIIGIVFDERSEPPEAVMSFLEGHGCEFVVRRNESAGEALTFPRMLEMVSSQNPDEITFYGHAKGVKYGPHVSPEIRQWAEVQYRTALDDWPTVWQQMQRYALTGPLRMLGRFRSHQLLSDWHYTGTFFWLRHAHVFSRPALEVPQFYGGVEVWPGLHFRREDTGCLLLDELRQLPYHPRFWSTLGGPAFRRWESSREVLAPPADLLCPEPIDGHTSPRTEQRPEELSWWIETLLAAGVRRLLSIGVMHGGAEWHVARVFRQHGKEIEITSVDLLERPEAARTFQDARERFGQSLRLVVGDSTSPEVRQQLDETYDAVFIDGDHTYRGARRDWELAQALHARVVGFHDIVDSHWHVANRCCVSRLWAEIQASQETQERSSRDWGGVGVVLSR